MNFSNWIRGIKKASNAISYRPDQDQDKMNEVLTLDTKFKGVPKNSLIKSE